MKERGTRSSIWRIMALGAVLLWSIWGTPAPCIQKVLDAPAGAGEELLDEKHIKEVVDKVDARLKESIALERSLAAEQLGVSPDDRERTSARLRSLKNTWERHLTAIRRRESLEKEKELILGSRATAKGVLINRNPPYPLSLFDAYLDKLASAGQKEESLTLGVNLARKQIREAELNLSKIRQDIRRLGEIESLAGDLPPAPGADWELRQSKLEEEIAEASLALETTHLENLLTELALVGSSREQLESQVEWIRSRLAQDQKELDQHIERIEGSRRKFDARINTLIMEQKNVERTWIKAQTDHEKAKESNDPGAIAESEAYLKEREAWRETYGKVLNQAENMLDLLNMEEGIWIRRNALIREPPSLEEIKKWQTETLGDIAGFEHLITLQHKEMAHLQTHIAALQKQMKEREPAPKILRHGNNRLTAVEKQAERTLEFLSALLSVKELSVRLAAELEQKKKGYSLAEKLQSIGSWTGRLWNFELWVIDDQGVTVKKVVTALIILIAGLIIARIVISAFIRRLLPRARLDENASAAVEKLLYYAALVFIALFTLRTVNIPLTAFTFLGGAIAIGVGFGAQNLINNFISGFIIMIERPIKIGDMIEVKESFGTIEEIGARCTRIRTAGNVHILVPNSSFLEKEITNWTLSDQRVRAQIPVGVAYGSDTRRVAELMRKAAVEHGKVLGTPEPFVIFDDFGDNSLVFQLFFWIRIARLMDRRIIESDVRFHIDSLFWDAGIVIAFPQRDVHLDTTGPLRIEMAGASQEKE